MRERLMPWMVFVQPDLPPQDGTLLLIITSKLTAPFAVMKCMSNLSLIPTELFTGKCLKHSLCTCLVLVLLILLYKSKHFMLTS